jgi:hypothetical protein
MQIRKSFPNCETSATRVRRGRTLGRRMVLTATMFLLSASGIGLAQSFGSDNAFLPSPVRTVSTVPPNGDLNPYGVAFVPGSFETGWGPLKHGDILVSNFNNSANLQGTGTTIVRIPASGAPSVFFQGGTGLGLSTALGTLQYGFIVVGNAPTTDGTSATAMPGSLLVINNQGKLIQTISNAWIQYPWDMALVDHGSQATAFVTNALNGTVSRLDFQVSASGLKLLSAKTIASGYVHRGDPVALFVAPTGAVYDADRDRLYVASTGDNAVFAIPDASSTQEDNKRGFVIYQDEVHLHGALGLVAAPNGHLLVSNNDTVNSDPNQPSEIVEFTKDGNFVKELSVDPSQGGSFGMAIRNANDQPIFAAVDDNTAALIIWTLNLP